METPEICRRFTPAEQLNLKNALLACEQLNGDSSRRKHTFTSAGLPKEFIGEIQFDGSDNEFCERIYAKFIENHSKNLHLLGKLLEYLREISSSLKGDKDLADHADYCIKIIPWFQLLDSIHDTNSSIKPFLNFIDLLRGWVKDKKLSDDKAKGILDYFDEIKKRTTHILTRKSFENKMQEIDSSSNNDKEKSLSEAVNILGKDIFKTFSVVLAVMHKDEAIQLDNGDAFCDYHREKGIHENFDLLKDHFNDDNITENWLDNYDRIPEKWQPFRNFNPDNCMSIQKLVEAVFDIELSECQQRFIDIKFIDIRDLNKDDDTDSFKQLKQLREEGCLLIVDLISMQHPTIQSWFRSIALDAFPNTFVVMLTPNNTILDNSDFLKIESIIEQRIDIDFYRRRNSPGLLHDECTAKGCYEDFRHWLTSSRSHLLKRQKCKDESEEPKGRTMTNLI